MAAFDCAGLAQFLRGPDVDDRHVGRQQALESGAVDMDDLGVKRRSDKEQRDADLRDLVHGVLSLASADANA